MACLDAGPQRQQPKNYPSQPLSVTHSCSCWTSKRSHAEKVCTPDDQIVFSPACLPKNGCSLFRVYKVFPSWYPQPNWAACLRRSDPTIHLACVWRGAASSTLRQPLSQPTMARSNWQGCQPLHHVWHLNRPQLLTHEWQVASALSPKPQPAADRKTATPATDMYNIERKQ